MLTEDHFKSKLSIFINIYLLISAKYVKLLKQTDICSGKRRVVG